MLYKHRGPEHRPPANPPVAMTSPRQQVLLVLCLVWVGQCSTQTPEAAVKENIQSEKAREAAEEQAVDFALEIDGVRMTDRDLDGVEIGDIKLDPIAMGPTADGEAVVYCPGTPVYGDVAIRAVPRSKLAGELYQWWLDTSQGGDVRKDISVITLVRNGKELSEIRRFNLMEAWPKSWRAADLSSTAADSETTVCSFARMEMSSGEEGVSLPGRVETGYEVTFTGSGKDETEAWSTKAGGAEQLVVVGGDACSENLLHQAEITGNELSEVKLRGPLTATRKALCQWITAAVLPEELDKELVEEDAAIEQLVAEVAKLRRQRRELLEQRQKRQVRLRANVAGDSASYAYAECIPSRYVFPSFSKSETAVLEEKVAFKPLRLTVT